jgi:hypothetical protein
MIPGSEQPRQSHYSSPTARLLVLDVLVPVPRFPVCVEAVFQLAVALARHLGPCWSHFPRPALASASFLVYARMGSAGDKPCPNQAEKNC